VFAVHGWYAKYRKKLLEAGIELWELKAHSQKSTERYLIGSRSSLHSKVMMLDKKRLFIGSMNIDPRSALYNTEMAVLLEKPDYVKQSVKAFEAQLKNGAYQLVLKDKKLRWIDHQTGEVLKNEPHAGHALTFGAWVAGILPIEKYL
ncbi:MAG: phospholipase D-like domain-containing protein, partial [Enterovibrio sp.]